MEPTRALRVLSYNIQEGGTGRLDYVFASPMLAARLAGCDRVTGRLAARASDHFPVWAEFE